ncbi:MAG: hypothetical protein O2890_07445 [Cyanobacteria bacterium]|nr:hypothetical protein [Cyanobacteriota bacterium]MDA0866240.1 hypothetical protein [Cyanobacteriota bacterium]
MIYLQPLTAFLALFIVGTTGRVPHDLAALVRKAKIEHGITDWCRGDFGLSHVSAYAISTTHTSADRGQYFILGIDSAPIVLAAFTHGSQLRCDTPAAASARGAAIAASPIIHGYIAPRWDTTVICGWVTATRALCWQYSPSDRQFIIVGEWIT